MIKNDLTVVMYHYVRDLKNSRFPSIKGLQTELFKEQIAYLKKWYTFVTVEDVIEAFKGKKELPPHSVLLTFDDAYIDHFITVFPILYNEGIQGAFYPPLKAVTEHIVLDVNKIHFILASQHNGDMDKLLQQIRYLLDKYREEYTLNTYEYYFDKLAVANRFDTKEVIFVKRLLQVELPESIRNIVVDELFNEMVGIDQKAFSQELYMSLDQIKTMVKCGMHVGSHGYDHYWLGSLSKEQQEFEIKKSMEFIKEVGGDINNWSICYPYGNYNSDTLDLLKVNGCQLGLTTEVNIITDKTAITPESILTLPRLDTNDLPKDQSSRPNKWYI